MLRATQTFGAIARVGPVAAQAEHVKQLLSDPARSGYVAVAQATEMAVSETIELQEGLREALERELEAVVVNGVLPRRFSAGEMQRIASLDGHARAGTRLPAPGAARRASDAQIRHSAAHAARAVHERARFQHNQVARLRRRDFEVLSTPFLWGAAIDPSAIETLADQLERRLQG
jgi:hypothetical protein